MAIVLIRSVANYFVDALFSQVLVEQVFFSHLFVLGRYFSRWVPQAETSCRYAVPFLDFFWALETLKSQNARDEEGFVHQRFVMLPKLLHFRWVQVKNAAIVHGVAHCL